MTIMTPLPAVADRGKISASGIFIQRAASLLPRRRGMIIGMKGSMRLRGVCWPVSVFGGLNRAIGTVCELDFAVKK
jgi:hypothetical protein